MSQHGLETPRKAVISSSVAIEQKEKGVLRFSQRPYQDLGLYYLNNNPKLFEDFQQALQRQYTDTPVYRSLLGVSDVSYLDTPQQRFIETFAKYFQNGTGFRQRILYMEATGHPLEASFLQAQYDVFNNWAKFETSADSQTFDTTPFYPNQVVQVVDPTRTPNFFGVYVRPEATLAIDSNWPYVDVCNRAKILGDGLLVLDQFTKRAVFMYPIQTLTVDLTGCEISQQGNPSVIGWVPGEYLQPLSKP